LLDLGYAHRVLLSLDLCQRSHLATWGGHGYAYLLDKFIPVLASLGVTQEQVDLMMTVNPRRVLAF
jgi:phosphotriesterase-related protein